MAETFAGAGRAAAGTRSPNGAKRNPGSSPTMEAVPGYAEPVITARTQLRSSLCAHSRAPLAPPGLRT